MTDYISLRQLKVGESLTVHHVRGEAEMKRRLEDLGVVEGTKIFCLGKSPLGDPRAYLIRSAVIALRNRDAETVLGTGGTP